MQTLTHLHHSLDNSDWDIEDEPKINELFAAFEERSAEAQDQENLRKALIERQAFLFSKTPDKKLSFRIAGHQTTEDGTEIPYEWPDIRSFHDKDFAYLSERFQATQNMYAKSEYGLVLYYAGKKKDNDFVKELLTALVALADAYYKKALDGPQQGSYNIYLRNTLANALFIADARKSVEQIEALNEQLIKFVFGVHMAWKPGSGPLIDFTDFAIKYIKTFTRYVQLDAMIDKNWENAKFLAGHDNWGAIFVADRSINLARALKMEIADWLLFKAAQYEELANQAINQHNLAAVSFIENALATYKEAKSPKNVARLESLYQQYRGTFQLQQIRTDIPQDETDIILEQIKKEIKQGDERSVASFLFETPMLRPLAEIREWSEKFSGQNFLSNMIPISIEDKFGNTIAQYTTEKDRKDFSLLDTYGKHIQVASQILMQFIFEALKEKKLTASAIIELLEGTWLNVPAIRNISGKQVEINYLETVKPGINSLLGELEKWRSEENYVPNFILSTDSLVLKVEYLLREICLKIGIATFKPQPKNPDIIMEKTLDDLLRSLEGKLDEDDWFLIKFILTEKVGENLRNRVAHGLLDNLDYGVIYPVYALICILKLSSYQFTEGDNQHDNR